MLSFLPSIVTGILFSIGLICTTLVWGLSLFFFALFKFVLPFKSTRIFFSHWIHVCAESWIFSNRLLMKLLLKTQIKITGLDQVAGKNWYMLISNHQSWLDIVILFNTFLYRIPILKFFMKRELITVPIIGQACWMMDYPLMYRYNKEFLKKHPEMKGKDLETTRKSCEHFKNTPTSVITFVEGTRNTKLKHKRQNSPYKYLLKPKAGGFSFVLYALSDCMKQIVDVTLVYPMRPVTLWDFMCGKLDNIFIDIKIRDITPDIIGNYVDNQEFRIKFQQWLNEVWSEKDRTIAEIIEKNNLNY